MYAFEDVAKICQWREVTILSFRDGCRKRALEAEASADLLLNDKTLWKSYYYKMGKTVSAEIASSSTCLIYVDNLYKD